MFVLGKRRSGQVDLVLVECGYDRERRAGASLAKRAMTYLGSGGLSGYAISNRTAQASAFVY